jgi:hypothetical protein
MAARQEEVFTHSSVVIFHISESAKIFHYLSLYRQFQAKYIICKN